MAGLVFTWACIMIFHTITMPSALIFFTELFYLHPVGRSNDVRVIGYPPPPVSTGEVWWHLIINEDAKGGTDKYPRFQPISGVSNLS